MTSDVEEIEVEEVVEEIPKNVVRAVRGHTRRISVHCRYKQPNLI